MTTTEFTNKIIESEKTDWFNSKEVNITNDKIGLNIKIKGIGGIYEFITRQIEGFQKHKRLPEEIQVLLEFFAEMRNRLIDLVNSKTASDPEWHQIKTHIERPRPAKFAYDSPSTEFLIRIFETHPQYYKGAYEYLSRNDLLHTSNNDYLTGYFLACEFLSIKISESTKRSEIEKHIVSKTRSEFESLLADSKAQLIQYLSDAHQKVNENSTKIDELVTERKEAYDLWFSDTYSNFESFYKVANERISGLEDLYKQKLKLEAPAKYWTDRASKLRKEGYRWLTGLIACTGVAAGILIWILNLISDGSFTQLFSKTSTAVKWSIALITLISFIAYAIRIIAKLTFSSFHLVRDAEEREQLTYVYLALQKEKGIDQTERHLIMQSLFSRADTGLLKDDSSPTMPGNIADKFMSK